MRYSYPATILKNGKKTGLRQPVTIESFLADRQKASVKQGCQLILFEMALVMAGAISAGKLSFENANHFFPKSFSDAPI